MKAIYQLMEDKFYEVKEVEFETEYLNLNETQAEAKFIFTNECVDHLIGNNINICDIFKTTFNSELKFLAEKNNPLVENKETVVVINNKLKKIYSV